MHGFEVVKKVADGSAVEAYLARTGAGNVLVQVSRPELAEGSQAFLRFLELVRSSQQRAHPALLTVQRTESGSDGRLVSVTGPVQGTTAADWLATHGVLEPARAVVWGTALCEALGYLHGLGVVHGNLSPTNIFLDGDADDPTPRLLDTGLLLFRHVKVTLPGLVPHEYLSPERVLGKRGGVAGDIYGLGVLLYELLVGEPPFVGRNDEETRHRVLGASVPPLPAGLEGWEGLLGRCLAKSVDARFEDVGQVCRALMAVDVSPVAQVTGVPILGFATPEGGRALADVEVGPGSQLGSYRLEAAIGEGGMGRVFLARHELLGRRVAIKLLRRELAAAPEHVQRFIVEAQAVNRVSHPHIVQVNDLVQDDAGRVYFVMEYLEGRSLRAAGRERAMELRKAVRLVREAAEALAAAHAVGVIHRDIKPDNLFLVPGQGGVEHIKVLDFGVARMMGGGAEAKGIGWVTDMRSTAVGQVVGTPLWMPPEQILGGEVDARADIYSLATVLYSLLSQSFPFAARTPEAVVKARVATDPRPLPVIGATGEALPAELRELVLRCLARDRVRRPASMIDLVEGLGAVERRLDTPAPALVAPVVQGPAVREPAAQPAIAAPPSRGFWPFALAGVGVGAAIAAWLLLH